MQRQQQILILKRTGYSEQKKQNQKQKHTLSHTMSTCPSGGPLSSFINRSLSKHTNTTRRKALTYMYIRALYIIVEQQFYYVENTQIVKFIRNYIRNSSGVLSISSLVKISMISLMLSLSFKLYLIKAGSRTF